MSTKKTHWPGTWPKEVKNIIEYLTNRGEKIKVSIKFIDADPQFNIIRFKHFVEIMAPGFEFTKSVNQVVDYFFSDFIKEKANAGFIMHGNTGSGKTLLIKLLCSFLNYSHYVENAINFCPTFQILSYFREKGEEMFSRLRSTKLLIIDDLGNEPILNDYGTRRNLLAELLHYRYDSYMENDCKTLFTTNLTLKELEAYYGQRVFSRLIEMCEYERTSLAGDDRRIINKSLKVNHSQFKAYLSILGENQNESHKFNKDYN